MKGFTKTIVVIAAVSITCAISGVLFGEAVSFIDIMILFAVLGNNYILEKVGEE